jgi:hypothetical protein
MSKVPNNIYLHDSKDINKNNVSGLDKSDPPELKMLHLGSQDVSVTKDKDGTVTLNYGARKPAPKLLGLDAYNAKPEEERKKFEARLQSQKLRYGIKVKKQDIDDKPGVKKSSEPDKSSYKIAEKAKRIRHGYKEEERETMKKWGIDAKGASSVSSAFGGNPPPPPPKKDGDTYYPEPVNKAVEKDSWKRILDSAKGKGKLSKARVDETLTDQEKAAARSKRNIRYFYDHSSSPGSRAKDGDKQTNRPGNPGEKVKGYPAHKDWMHFYDDYTGTKKEDAHKIHKEVMSQIKGSKFSKWENARKSLSKEDLSHFRDKHFHNSLEKAGSSSLGAANLPKIQSPSKRSKMSQKKQELLQMARLGKERPLTSTPIGHALANYTDPNSYSFDPTFATLLFRIAPKWSDK